MNLKRNPRFGTYFFTAIFSVIVLLRYVDFFQFEFNTAHFEEDPIELDISSEKLTKSHSGFEQLGLGEWINPNFSLPTFDQLNNRLFNFNGKITHRLKLFEKQKFVSNPLANLPQVYIRFSEHDLS